MAFTYANPATGDRGARQISSGKDWSATNNQVSRQLQPLRVEVLFIGGRRTDVTVERDHVYPKMFRVRQGDDLSDITNISRAKDAAISWVRPKGLGGDEVAHWRCHRQSRRAAQPVRKNGGAHG